MATKKRASTPAKRAPKSPDPRLTKLAALFAEEPRVTLGKAFSSITLQVDGKIFAMVVDDRVVFKLPRARVDELVAKELGRHFEPGPGRVMKEWVAMEAPRPTPATLAREAFAFVGGSK